jgi:CubicO group peptidase (beta-lactamase class C family)
MRGVIFLCCSLVIAAPIRGAEPPLPIVQPEAVGMDAEHLNRIGPAVQKLIDRKQFAGAVVAVARNGKLVYHKAFGVQGFTQKPMTTESIFRIYSMSKPITAAATLQLVDAGKLRLDDPVGKHLPQLANLRVYRAGVDGQAGEPVAPKNPVTIRDLLRHTAGLGYGVLGGTAVDRLYIRHNILDNEQTLAQMVTKLQPLPLVHEPGVRFNYSVASDVLGRVVEVVSGKPFDQYLQAHLFKPLGMADTGFEVKPDAAGRFTDLYMPQIFRSGLMVTDAGATSRLLKPAKFYSGGGGLVSTSGDYLRFAQAIADGGIRRNHRVLKAVTASAMTKNQLPEGATPINVGGFMVLPGTGFGYGVSVLAQGKPTDPIGEWGWGGIASTHFFVSPKDKLIVITMTQRIPFWAALTSTVRPIVYSAIRQPIKR